MTKVSQTNGWRISAFVFFIMQGLLFQSTNASDWDDGCKQEYEYAEMKDLPVDDLVKLYCDWSMSIRSSNYIMGITSSSCDGRTGNFLSCDIYFKEKDSRDKCSFQLERVKRLFKSKNINIESIECVCPPSIPRPPAEWLGCKP